MLREEIRKVIERAPRLTIEGISYRNNQLKKMTLEEHKKEFAKDQEDLLNSTEECSRICKWLNSVQKIKTINQKHSSYGLKEIAEAEIGYITNGQFIAAAIHCGFDFRHSHSEGKVYLNMSEESIKQKVK